MVIYPRLPFCVTLKTAIWMSWWRQMWPRGLDISGVTHVYNYDIPQDPESACSPDWWTGRAGKSGRLSLSAPNEWAICRSSKI